MKEPIKRCEGIKDGCPFVLGMTAFQSRDSPNDCKPLGIKNNAAKGGEKEECKRKKASSSSSLVCSLYVNETKDEAGKKKERSLFC